MTFASAASRKGFRRPTSPSGLTCPGRRSTRSRPTGTPPRSPWPSRSPGFSGSPSRRYSMQTTTKTSRKYLATPIFGVLMGVVYLVALSVGGEVGYGVFAFAVMVAFSAALLLARRRSETVKGLLDRRDERISAIDLRATAI